MNWQIGIDEPRDFQLLNPSTLEEAVEWMQRYGHRAALLAGGCDLLDKLKTQWCAPEYVVNLKSIAGLKAIDIDSGKVRLGALCTLGEMERHSELQRLLPALVRAAFRVATPQIRNLGTLGGNLLQDSRCPYYRGPWNCYRRGGIVCDALHGLNAEHAIFGGERCYTVTPSDLAPVLVALHASATIFGPRGSRRKPVSDLYLLPREDIRHMHRLAPDEILTRIEIPVDRRRHCVFIKYAVRQAWDFALASVALAVDWTGTACRNCSIVLGAVAPRPWRSAAAENILEGSPLSANVIEAAARAATRGAEPLSHNEYKIPLVRKLVRSALQELASRLSS